MSKVVSPFESEVKNCWAYGKLAVELLERVAVDHNMTFDALWTQYFPNLSHVKALKNARHFIKQCDPRNSVAPAKSDYHFYLTAQSQAIQQKGETYEIAKHGKAIGNLWKALSETERATYQQLAATDKERRQKELDAIEEAIRAGTLQDSPFRRSVRHRTGNVSALNMYVKEMTRTLRESEPTMSNTQRMKQIHQQWSGLSEGDRAKYQKIADETNKAHAEAAAAPAPTATTAVAATPVATPAKKEVAPKAAKPAKAAAAPTPAAPAKEAAPKAAKATKEATPATVPAVVAKEVAPKAAKGTKAAPKAAEPTPVKEATPAATAAAAKPAKGAKGAAKGK
jgi:hypothetical protein